MTHGPGAGGPVSADQLRHPLSSRARRLIRKAERLIAAGKHKAAIEQLRQGVADPSAAPYAYSLLGQEYMRGGAYAAAVPALQQATQLLPSDAGNHANLGFALVMTSQLAPAESELMRALQLQPANPKTHLALGVLRFCQGTHDDEAEGEFKIAARELPVARLILAKFYLETARADASEAQFQKYLNEAGVRESAALRQWLQESR